VWVALVAVTVGSPGVGLPTGGGPDGESPPGDRNAFQQAFPGGVPDLLLGVVAGVALLWLLFVLVGAFLEFPFLRWLRGGDLALRAEVREHWRRAAGLAAFRFGLGLLAAAVPVAAVASVGPGARPARYLLVVGDYWGAFALLGLVTALVGAFTTAFVVASM
jgi:hypothetical protein